MGLTDLYVAFAIFYIHPRARTAHRSTSLPPLFTITPSRHGKDTRTTTWALRHRTRTRCTGGRARYRMRAHAPLRRLNYSPITPIWFWLNIPFDDARCVDRRPVNPIAGLTFPIPYSTFFW